VKAGPTLAIALALAGMTALASGAPVEDPTAADAAAIQAVCGRCHTLQLVTAQPRSEEEWMGVLQKMANLGAKGSDVQFDGVVRYLSANLTVVNVNTASPETLARVLGLVPAVADSIAARRDRLKFRDLADLETLPGIDRAALEARKGRILF
jgi:DNA uptake protein ComE-like DNA-binding protein